MIEEELLLKTSFEIKENKREKNFLCLSTVFEKQILSAAIKERTFFRKLKFHNDTHSDSDVLRNLLKNSHL